MRVLARIERPVQSETPHGGRTVSYDHLGMAWLACGARRRRERSEGGQATRGVETMSATCRADARIAEGRVLRFGGADWTIRGVDADGPGRMKLTLERVR
ncbi:MAG: head-tail adaptor protein [Caulobacterales bacterium]|nr:head-tail adaptor protein [Caulobacterales bacterium]